MKPEAGSRTKLWNRVEYGRLIQRGILNEDDPVELLDGRLFVKEPQHTPHATAIRLAAEALRTAFGPGWVISQQLPIVLDDRSEPEPDVCVAAGAPRDFRDAHPTRPVLIVEVAQSKLRIARGRKAAAYARAGIADYWIVNLVDRVLEVHRDPQRTRVDRPRWRYASVETLAPTATVTPLAAPTAPIAVIDLLP